MGYKHDGLTHHQQRYTQVPVTNILPNGRWRHLALLRLLTRTLTLFLIDGLRDFILFKVLIFCIKPKRNSFMIKLWWVCYFLLTDIDSFEQDYMQAWRDRLESDGNVENIHIFVSRDHLQVPILSIQNLALSNGLDRTNFYSLRMWYSWMQLKRGFGEDL